MGRFTEMIRGIQDTRLRANIKISLTGSKKSEVIRSLFLTLTLSLHSSLGVLAWQLSSLRLLHLVRESKLPTPVFYILKESPVRKQIADIRVQWCSLNDPPQITRTAPDQPTRQGHGVLCLALHGHWTWPRRYTWFSVSSITSWLKLGRGSPKDSDWGMV